MKLLHHSYSTNGVCPLRGTNSGNGNFWFGRANSGTATYNLSNGTFTSYGSLRLGSTSNTTGIFNQSGGTVNVTGNQDFSFGYDSGSSGKYYQTGGTLNTQRNIDLRRSGAVLDIGGAVTATAAGIGVNIGTTSGSSGEVILREGGVLTTSYIKRGSGTASVTLYGGTLKAKAANAKFLENLGVVAIGASGVTFDTDYAIGVTGTTFSAPVGITAFTLTGTGSLDLSGVTIDLAAMPTAPYTIATAAGSGSFVGCPALTVNGEPLSGGWKVVKSADGKKITIKRRKGVMIIAY